ncbi:MAG: hypothetical protein JO190_08915 [Candidatus Eremiobacteraeota bacterium]|nr:hypothetical protein [Candidatus Eremiobacteraeota bacterium]MBV8498123.1 hypothetical protein [Candidatus Eremiobacteraeota bacterium]
MKFFIGLTRLSLGLVAAALAAACASQPQLGSIPQGPASSTASQTMPNHARTVNPAVSFKFKTINNNTDPTFNQLLGINDDRTISGYYGSGAIGHPNKGYIVVPPYGQSNFTSENFPGSAQTQVTCINNGGSTGGFWIDNAGVNRGFIDWNGVFTSYAFPLFKPSAVTQILGLNDYGVAVGFYTDARGVNHGFEYNRATFSFQEVKPPGGTNVTASAINDNGDIVGFYTSSSQVVGFLEKGGTFTTFSYPESPVTDPFGVNDKDDIVGSYAGASSTTHGFLLTDVTGTPKFRTIDDPNGIGTTVINGINSHVSMVGFYVDSTGNTDGMLITRNI